MRRSWASPHLLPVFYLVALVALLEWGSNIGDFLFPAAAPELHVTNPRWPGRDGDDFHWIEDWCFIDIHYRNSRQSVWPFELVLDAEAGPADQSPTRVVALVDGAGQVQRRSFRGRQLLHFPLLIKRGRNHFVLWVLWPRDRRVHTPGEAGKPMLGVRSIQVRPLPPRPMRNPYVDYLRGAAILLVLANHFLIFPAGLPGAEAITRIETEGYYGVVMFFVVSGYLITSRTLLHYGSLSAIPPREFYAMRTARIAPCLLLTVAALVALNAAHVPGFRTDDIGRRVAYALTFRYNLYHVNFSDRVGILPWDVLWSLAVEEVFYLAFPLVCHLYKKPRYIGIMLGIIVLNGPWYRHNYYMREGNYKCIGMYLGCFDSIALGCLVAMAAARHPLKKGGGAAAVAAAGAILALASIILFPLASHFVVGPAGVGLGAALYVYAVHGRKSPAPGPWPLRTALALLASCGILSYEIYLYHAFVVTSVLALVNRIAVGANWAMAAAAGYMALFGVATFCLAWAIHRYYAEPLGRALRRALGAPLSPKGGAARPRDA